MAELTLRPSTDDDVPAMVDVADRSHRLLTGHPARWSQEGMRRMRSLPSRDATRDFPVVTLDGRVVAWAGFMAAAPYSEMFTGYHRDPDLGPDEVAAAVGLLVDHVRALAAETLEREPDLPDRLLTTEIPEQDAQLREALAAHGYAPNRYEYEMAIELDPSTAAPEWPTGSAVLPLRGPLDAAVVTDLLADSFSDHPGDLPFSLEVITHVLSGTDFNTDASAIAADADGPVGLVLCRDRPDSGYVWVIGVVTRARRRGLGAALLRHAFHAYAVSGRTVVTLDVDGANDSGALAVYRDAGMSVRATSQLLARPAQD